MAVSSPEALNGTSCGNLTGMLGLLRLSPKQAVGAASAPVWVHMDKGSSKAIQQQFSIFPPHPLPCRLQHTSCSKAGNSRWHIPTPSSRHYMTRHYSPHYSPLSLTLTLEVHVSCWDSSAQIIDATESAKSSIGRFWKTVVLLDTDIDGYQT